MLSALLLNLWLFKPVPSLTSASLYEEDVEERVAQSLQRPRLPFQPQKKEVLYWFDVINTHIFENKLKFFDQVTISPLKEHWAYVNYNKKKSSRKLHLHDRFPNLSFFLDILGHEMVHLWQLTQLKDNKGKHDKSFYLWKDKFKKYGLKLEKSYEEKRK